MSAREADPVPFDRFVRGIHPALARQYFVALKAMAAGLFFGALAFLGIWVKGMTLPVIGACLGLFLALALGSTIYLQVALKCPACGRARIYRDRMIPLECPECRTRLSLTYAEKKRAGV